MLEYYGFALFIAILICLIAVLCKFLFSGIKRQHMLLDEKESKLLKLYQSVEDVLEDFSDQSDEARAAIEKLVSEARVYKDEALRVQSEALLAIETAGAARAEAEAAIEAERAQTAAKSRTTTSRAKTGAKQAEETDPAPPAPAKRKAKSGVASFQKIIDEIEGDAAEQADKSAKPGRNDAILALKAEGKTVQKIAQELGITQNEVKLVIGLNK